MSKEEKVMENLKLQKILNSIKSLSPNLIDRIAEVLRDEITVDKYLDLYDKLKADPTIERILNTPESKVDKYLNLYRLVESDLTMARIWDTDESKIDKYLEVYRLLDNDFTMERIWYTNESQVDKYLELYRQAARNPDIFDEKVKRP
jgi:hypothetical protein